MYRWRMTYIWICVELYARSIFLYACIAKICKGTILEITYRHLGANFEKDPNSSFIAIKFVG